MCKLLYPRSWCGRKTAFTKAMLLQWRMHHNLYALYFVNMTCISPKYILSYLIYTFYPNLLIFLHRYICHLCDISQLCTNLKYKNTNTKMQDKAEWGLQERRISSPDLWIPAVEGVGPVGFQTNSTQTMHTRLAFVGNGTKDC